MGKYSFDEIIPRRGTGSVKYDLGPQMTGRDDLLPMWVADMDFKLPEEVLSVIRARVDHGIFGYTSPDDRYYDVLTAWFKKRYGWEISREWNTVVGGVVYGVTQAVRALTQPGDAVMIQEPVYYPFRSSIEGNGRVCVNHPLKRNADGRYEMDLPGMEETIRRNNVKAMVLCSPHNPVSRVWTREELAALDALCRGLGVRMIVDEIHCDFIYPGHTFVPFGTLGEESLMNAVICTAPSKTFNIAGLSVSNILIANPELRKAFRAAHGANGGGGSNAVGLTAARAVYEFGEAWLDELLEYLWGNVQFVREFLEERLPQVRLTPSEGTYLLWMEFSEVVQDDAELKTLLRDQARLWLDEGEMFGPGGEWFARMNIACPRSIVQQAMEQLAEAIDARTAAEPQNTEKI